MLASCFSSFVELFLRTGPALGSGGTARFLWFSVFLYLGQPLHLTRDWPPAQLDLHFLPRNVRPSGPGHVRLLKFGLARKLLEFSNLCRATIGAFPPMQSHVPGVGNGKASTVRKFFACMPRRFRPPPLPCRSLTWPVWPAVTDPARRACGHARPSTVRRSSARDPRRDSLRPADSSARSAPVDPARPGRLVASGKCALRPPRCAGLLPTRPRRPVPRLAYGAPQTVRR
jgi:hypothetical protein